MTGFGAGRATVGNEEISVELRSVNHKFCEVKARLPRELSAFEQPVSKQIKDRLSRGAVDLSVKRGARGSVSGQVPIVDAALAKEYRRAFAELAAAAGVPDTTTLAMLAGQLGVIRLDEPQTDVASAQAALDQALGAALTALEQMRSIEGKAIAIDLTARLAQVRAWVSEIQKLGPVVLEEYHQRLKGRIEELLKGIPADPQRLAQEIAYAAERSDVAEELTRLDSHLKQFQELLSSHEPVGRKMDFLVQEMHREVNTTGSKSQHPEISSRVVALKAELERIREQVQNVE